MNFNNIFTLTIIVIFSPLLGKLFTNIVALLKLYDKSRKGNNLIDLLNRLTLREFEIWAGEYLSHIGFSNIVLPSFDGSDKKNIICIKNGLTYYVKCNRMSQNKSLSIEDMEQFLGEMISDNICNGIIITTTTASENIENYIENIPKSYSLNIISLSESQISSSPYSLNIN